jgi:glycosyltransferase involved in cell wall biosynthesis
MAAIAETRMKLATMPESESGCSDAQFGGPSSTSDTVTDDLNISSTLVSILIPCYNAEDFIGQCIESALAQSWPEKEIIVIDDGSTDRSLDVIRSFEGSIRWETGPNRGGNSARNRLLALSRGAWLQYLDADDYLQPKKIQGQMQFAAMHPQAEVICSPVMSEKYENGKPARQEGWLPPQRDPWIMLARQRMPQTGGSLWRRSVLIRVGGWRVEQRIDQEFELYVRLLQAGANFAFFDECLAVWRDGERPTRLSMRLREARDPNRLLILDEMEFFLRDRSELTSERHQAINDARHQIARRMWGKNPTGALEVMRTVAKSDAAYYPSESVESPAAYRLVYGVFGFKATQQIADCRRKVRSVIGRSK